MIHRLPGTLLLLLAVARLVLARDLNIREQCLSRPTFICALRPTEGNIVRGTVAISTVFLEDRPRRKCVIRVYARVANLTAGRHGFHIHTYGDATSDTAASAGGHFTNVRGDEIPHGFPNSPRRHWGDLGNLVANRDGVAMYNRVDTVARYHSVLGRSIVVHQLADMGPDSQPSGAAGSRQATCVIGFANPDTLTMIMH